MIIIIVINRKREFCYIFGSRTICPGQSNNHIKILEKFNIKFFFSDRASIMIEVL